MMTNKNIDLKKTRKACDQCRSRKVKCDGLTICSRCSSKGYECTYNYIFKKRLRKNRKEITDKPKRKRGRPRKISLNDNNDNDDHNNNNNNNSTISKIVRSNNTVLVSRNNDSTCLNTINGKEISKGFLGVKPIIFTNNTISNSSTPASFTDSSACTFNHTTPNNELNNSINSNINSNINNNNNNNHHHLNHLNHLNNNSFSNTSPQFNTNLQNYSPTTFFNNSLIKNPPPNNLNLSQPLISNVSMNSITSDNNSTNSNNTNENILIEKRLQKMESMISILLDKISNQNNQNNENLSNNSTISNLKENSNSPNLPSIKQNSNLLNSHSTNLFHHNRMDSGTENIQKWIALLMHTSLFFLSPLGLKTLEKKMESPEAMYPLKEIVNVSAPFERRIISIWTNPILQSQLTPLPSRYNIECLLNSFSTPFFMLKILDLNHLKHLLGLYCDFRDNLIPEPQFTYSDYFLMNTSLLIACLVIDEISDKSISDAMPLPDFPSMKKITDGLLDNSLFYYSRLSVISGNLSTIVGALFLSFYADSISLSRAAYLISTCAIRQAQELGLHIEQSYRTLPQHERNLRINIWWICYMLDKELCIRWGQAPVINDNDITTPPLAGFESFWSPNEFNYNNNNNKKSISKRSLYNLEIQELLESMMKDPLSTVDIEQYITIDYSFLVSKVYNNFLRAGALKNKNKNELNNLLNDTLEELENWRSTIPKAIRPITESDNEKQFFDYIRKLKTNLTAHSLHLMILSTALQVRYHHVKLMIYRAYTKHCILEFGDVVNETLFLEPISSARSILKMACVVDSRFGNFVNYFIFYPFNAFLSICGFYIHIEKEVPNLKSDLQLLINCIKLHFTPFISNKKKIEKGGLVELILRGMFYATYITCVNRFGDIPLDGLDILDDIKALADGTKTAEEIVYPLLNTDDTVNMVERPFCKLPYFSNENSSILPNNNNNNNNNIDSNDKQNNNHLLASSILKQNNLNEIPSLGPHDADRTPNVSFLLSPANQNVENLEIMNGNSNRNNVNISNNGNNSNQDDKNPFLNNDKDNKMTTTVAEPDFYMNDFNTKDSLFQNMLNIPNYFFDYLGDESSSINVKTADFL